MPTLFDPIDLVETENEQPTAGDWWDLNGTIHDYSYLTHNFFRYYGKFPSVLAKKVIEEFLPVGRNALILDTYSGCGTTLVEAMLAGHDSVGVDINPLAILAASVKTSPLPERELDRAFSVISESARATLEENTATDKVSLSEVELAKWFPGNATSELLALREAIYGLSNGQVKDFYLLALAAIIRRVSTAFDAEVRPHFNKSKPVRLPLEAFTRKTLDMRTRLREFGSVVKPSNHATSYLADNRALDGYGVLTPESFDLALTHPPYLNCFDYIPVYRMELQWLEDLMLHWSLHENNLMGQMKYAEIKEKETHSWPATPKVIDKYRQGNLSMLRQLFMLLRDGAFCAVVIGDSTLKGVLMPVHQWFIELGLEAGFHHHRTIYRTTHYGTGKYAYADRSHYHGAAEKRDAILIFRKP